MNLIASSVLSILAISLLIMCIIGRRCERLLCGAVNSIPTGLSGLPDALHDM